MAWIHKMEKENEEKERWERRTLLKAESSEESDFSSWEDNGGWGKDWEERVSSSEDEKPSMSMFNIDIFIINYSLFTINWACSPFLGKQKICLNAESSMDDVDDGQGERSVTKDIDESQLTEPEGKLSMFTIN